MSYSRGGGVPASRSVALDLMLRTFMNSSEFHSSEFHSSNPRVWDNIAKLVPGTTPQQCCQRWEELRCLSSGSVAGDYSGLTAHGRPLSHRSHTHRRQMAKFVHSMLNSPSSTNSGSLPPADVPMRPQSQCEGTFAHRAAEQERHVQRREREGGKVANGGKFVANFYQNMMNKEREDRRDGACGRVVRKEGHQEVDMEGWAGGRVVRKEGHQEVDMEGWADGRVVRKEGHQEADMEEWAGGRVVRKEGHQEADMEGWAGGRVVRKEGHQEADMEGWAGGKGSVTRESKMEERFEGQRQQERTRDLEMALKQREEETALDSKESAASPHGPNMVIHVFDEPRKLKRDFHCPRGVLVREMRYFSEYLSSDAQLWDEVDISVHCDIPVFEWLMRYAKRGLCEGPCGEIIDDPLEPPSLEPGTVVSILISSDFLKMSSLVEECLDFCHDHISAVLASPTNMGCISDKLRKRLAAKFTPVEVEKIADKRDKIRSKLFIHQIQELFSPTHYHAECPASAATLHRCKHCGKLLTSELHNLLPCTPNRLEVHQGGQLVYSHERDESWSVSAYLTSLQHQHGLSPRDIYWRLWGLANWLQCRGCGQPFQCSDLCSCYYHPQPAIGGRSSTGPPVHICCGSLPDGLSPFPLAQRGCCVRDHSVADPSDSPLSSLLLSHRDVIVCTSTEHSASRDRHDKSASGTGTRARKKESWTGSSIPLSSSNTQLSFLKNMEKVASRKTNPNSERHLEPVQSTKSTEGGASNTSEGAVAKQQGPINNAVDIETSSSARRQVSGELSELEEDEEEEVHGVPAPLNLPADQGGSRHRRDKKAANHRSSLRRRHSRKTTADLRDCMSVSASVAGSAPPPVLTEWVWDSSKSRRWNQDRQRESDECRLTALSDQLSQLATPTPPTTHNRPYRDRDREANYAGGIFSRLEAQFRVQQATRALTQQQLLHSTGSRVQGRRRW